MSIAKFQQGGTADPANVGDLLWIGPLDADWEQGELCMYTDNGWTPIPGMQEDTYDRCVATWNGLVAAIALGSQ